MTRLRRASAGGLVTNVERSAFVIEARHARADGAEDFIGDGAGPFGDVVGGYLVIALVSDDHGLSHFFNLIVWPVTAAALTRIIHDGSSRNRQAALRERRAEPGGPEAYSCSTSRDRGASPRAAGLSEQRIGDCSRSVHE